MDRTYPSVTKVYSTDFDEKKNYMDEVSKQFDAQSKKDSIVIWMMISASSVLISLYLATVLLIT